MIGLTEKQEKFALHYARHRNSAAAYLSAYEAKNSLPSTIASEASRLVRHPAVAARIEELKEAAVAASDVTLELSQVFQRLCLQIVTDPRELMTVRTGNCRYCNGEDFGYRWREAEFQEAFKTWQDNETKGLHGPMPDCSGGFGFRPFYPPNPECPECGGIGISHAGIKPSDEYSPGAAALFEGVKQTAHGIEVKTADKAKALEMAIRMLGGFDDKLDLKASVKAAIATATDQHTAAALYAEMIKAG